MAGRRGHIHVVRNLRQIWRRHDHVTKTNSGRHLGRRPWYGLRCRNLESPGKSAVRGFIGGGGACEHVSRVFFWGGGR